MTAFHKQVAPAKQPKPKAKPVEKQQAQQAQRAQEKQQEKERRKLQRQQEKQQEKPRKQQGGRKPGRQQQEEGAGREQLGLQSNGHPSPGLAEAQCGGGVCGKRGDGNAPLGASHGSTRGAADAEAGLGGGTGAGEGTRARWTSAPAGDETSPWGGARPEGEGERVQGRGEQEGLLGCLEGTETDEDALEGMTRAFGEGAAMKGGIRDGKGAVGTEMSRGMGEGVLIERRGAAAAQEEHHRGMEGAACKEKESVRGGQEEEEEEGGESESESEEEGDEEEDGSGTDGGQDHGPEPRGSQQQPMIGEKAAQVYTFVCVHEGVRLSAPLCSCAYL